MTAISIPRDRPTIIQYLLWCMILIVGLGASLALLLSAYQAKVEPVYYDAKTFTLYPRASPNPLIDVKNLLLRRYSSPRTDDSRPQKETTDGIKKAIYEAFLVDDTKALIAIANRISYESKPSTVSYTMAGGIVDAEYSDFDVHEVIDALDTTVLLTAYLFDRMNLRSAARKYYSIYHQTLRMIVVPGLDSPFQLVSRRMVAIRAKLRLLLDHPVSKGYADASYVDSLIETFLQETLADKVFSRYRRQGIIYPQAAKKEFHSRPPTTIFDPELLIQAIKGSNGREKNLLVYELCMSQKFMGSDIQELCLPQSTEAMFGQRSFATATLKFASLLRFVNENPNRSDFEYERGDATEPVLAKNERNAKPIDQVRQAFEELATSAERSLEDESSFLHDDILFLTYRFYKRVGDQERAIKSLCQIARMRVEDADYVLLAKAILGSNLSGCTS